ncbi:AAA domain-containing protein [Edaphobacillus lindanitolerans]|uniref:AAA domain-containing protein n=1 Tax=Edaphobacillus lindanitolerans TaxID=550447 RepID=A0A1U7PIJ6_9BACI|nr:AAA domain-containing protein [Edaphobacillus lindanitolerans]SIT66016.1 Protein of unknown function [Edaphobacillus lindanitolerans]
MVQLAGQEKAINFFEYLRSLNMLTGKIKRDYREHDAVWFVDDIMAGFDCRVLDGVSEKGAVLEIRRPRISAEERMAPAAPRILDGWLGIGAVGLSSFPKPLEQKVEKNNEGISRSHSFVQNADRVKAYERWQQEWAEWSVNLQAKETAMQLYETFFNLLTRFENEGESLEFVLGQGLIVWHHPDPSVGTIRTPVLSMKLELSLDAENGIIHAKPVEDMFEFEQEPFLGVPFPQSGQVQSLIERLPEIAPDDPTEIVQFLKEFVHLADAGGRYSEADEMAKPAGFPVVYPKGLFMLRSKQSRVIRDDLAQIINGIEDGTVNLSPSVLSVLGVDPPVQQEIERTADEEDDILYFPLPSNDQQKDIVKRIRRHFGVTIQGPPGTGKTHTIANLVSHFLSEGKRVLITSQKESPLKVLKNKIPEGIRDLCVPVLGGGRESLQDIESSTRLISEKLGELDPDQLRRHAGRDREELIASREREEELLRRLCGYAEAEGTAIHYRDERLTKPETAKRLAESPANAGWIPDPVALEEEFPLEETDFRKLWNLKNKIGPDWFGLADQWLPDPQQDLISLQRLKWLVNDRTVLEKGQEEARMLIERHGWPDDTESLRNFEETVRQAVESLREIDLEQHAVLIGDLAAGGQRARRWVDWLAKMDEMNDTLASLYAELASHRLAPPPFPVSEVRDHLDILADELEDGKEPGLLFFMGKGRKAKYLWQHDWLDGHPIRTQRDIDVFRKFVDYQDLRYTLLRIYNAPSRESGMSEMSADARRFPYEMEKNLSVFKKIVALTTEIESLRQSPYTRRTDEEAFYDPERLENSLLREVRIARKYPAFEEWKETIRSLAMQLREGNSREDAHPVVGQMIGAIEILDEEVYAELLSRLEELHARQAEALELKGLLSKLSAMLPLTAARLQERLGVEEPFPEDWEEAFGWRMLKTWVDTSADMDTESIRRQIAEEQKEQADLINLIVKNSTWANLLENITEREKNALSAWKSSIKRYGKGTGKHARYYLKTARDNMKVAQSAIPVWIMPINQVLENFPATNEKFDVIIFDESSQCDIYSVNVLLRGKKAIVVGDEEQISPQAIGVKFDDVRELGRRFLKGVPNFSLLDGNTSLYELAEATFPKGGKLMLREHFRSVEQIIQFSNRLSYDGEMVPMRVPFEKERFHRPVMAVEVEDGENDELQKDLNIPEADRIVQDIVRMVSDAQYDGQTFGVISLHGQKQHRMLETKIRNAIGDREFVRRRILCGSPYTLQGDERDIIFLSMVVAPNRRFWALTGMADKQRINVAASRARNQMRLYHSVGLEDLNIEDLRYRLLGYCMQTEVETERLADPESLCETRFELDVYHTLESEGYRVKPKVKVGRYMIDFVIEGEKDRLAIECEGDKWQGADRFLSGFRRRQSLERVGWEFRSLRGNEFYFNREATMESIQRRLSEKGIEHKS